jgi:hypothetical protein
MLCRTKFTVNEIFRSLANSADQPNPVTLKRREGVLLIGKSADLAERMRASGVRITQKGRTHGRRR